MQLVHDDAPPALRRVIDFINTRDIEGETDALGAPSLLVSWLAGRQLVDAAAPAQDSDLELARAVREALRSVALANTDGSSPVEAWDVLNRIAEQVDVTIRVGPRGGQLAIASGGVHGALGSLVLDVFTAMQDGSWTRLKACRNDGCLWAFYDRSRNRSAAWCSMAECGNRVKTRAYRARSKAVSSPR